MSQEHKPDSTELDRSTTVKNNQQQYSNHLTTSSSSSSSSSASSSSRPRTRTQSTTTSDETERDNDREQQQPAVKQLSSSSSSTLAQIERLPITLRLAIIFVSFVCLLSIVTDGWSHIQSVPYLCLTNTQTLSPQLNCSPLLTTSLSTLDNFHSTSSSPSRLASSSWKSISENYRGLPVCDPFSEPGTVVYNSSTYLDANWIPFRSSCPPSPDFISALYTISNISNSISIPQRNTLISHPKGIKTYQQSGDRREERDVLGRPYPDLNFLRGKTIVYLGDSVDRNALQHLHEILDANVRTFSYDSIDHAPTPDWDTRNTPWEVDLGLLHPRNRNSSSVGYEQRPKGEFAGLNCRFINGFFYGLDDVDEFSVQVDWHAPGLAEDRINQLFLPMIEQFEKEDQEPIGFISIQSGLWDLAFFGRKDRELNQTVDHPLSNEQLKWYETRFRSILRTTKKRFPKIPIWVRILHRVGDQFWASHDWQAGLKNGIGKGFVNFFSNIRIHQIRSLQIYICESERLPFFDFGQVWEGFQSFQDKVHPLKNPGGILFNQAMIYHIWMESIGRSNWEEKLLKKVDRLPHSI